MNKNKTTLALFTIFFLGILFFRELPIGQDSIYYLGQACKTTPAISAPLEFLFSLLPCNLFLVKTIMAFVGLLIAFGLLQMANIIWPERQENYLVLFFCFGMTFFVQFLLQFENDQFGFLIGLYATLLFLQNETTIKNQWVAVLSFCWIAAAIYCWQMSALFLFVWAGYGNKAAILGAILSGWFLLQVITPNGMVLENIPLLGILLLGISIFFIWSAKENKQLLLPFLFLVGFAVLNAKFAVFAEWLAGFMVLGSYYTAPKSLQWVFLFSVVAFSTVLFFNSLNQYPNSNDIFVTKEAIMVSTDLNTDFGNSWLIYFEKGKPDILGYAIDDKNIFEKKGYVLTVETLPCLKVLEQETKGLKLWKCF